MKPLGSYSIRGIVIRPWVMYALASFMLVSILLPFLFDTKYVEYVVQLVMWIINVLVFMFLISATIKDNMQINKESSISILDYFLTIFTFFFILVFVPMFGDFDRFVEVMSSFVRVI